jgi:hypothetical protein
MSFPKFLPLLTRTLTMIFRKQAIGKKQQKKVGSKFKEGKTLSDEFNWSKCWIQMKILQQNNDPHTFKWRWTKNPFE